MPFGLNVSQDVFQHRMVQILEQCDGVIGIADDIIVFGDSEQSHDRNLHRLMTVAATTGFKFNSSKCTIKDPHVLFFGMMYDVNGVHPDPSKVKAMPPPTDPTKLREFLGMVTYLSSFIPNLSSHTADLCALLQKDIDYVWSPSHQQCFEKVRDQICESATLRYFDPTVIQVEASLHRLGARLQRMLMRLQPYDLTLHYRPGKEVPNTGQCAHSIGRANTPCPIFYGAHHRA